MCILFSHSSTHSSSHAPNTDSHTPNIDNHTLNTDAIVEERQDYDHDEMIPRQQSKRIK